MFISTCTNRGLLDVAGIVVKKKGNTILPFTPMMEQKKLHSKFKIQMPAGTIWDHSIFPPIPAQADWSSPCDIVAIDEERFAVAMSVKGAGYVNGMYIVYVNVNPIE